MWDPACHIKEGLHVWDPVGTSKMVVICGILQVIS